MPVAWAAWLGLGELFFDARRQRGSADSRLVPRLTAHVVALVTWRGTPGADGGSEEPRISIFIL